MIEPRGLIGFGVAFLACAWLLSTALGAGFLVGRSWWRGHGPLVERRAAAFALVAPPLLSLAIVLILAGYSALGPSLGAVDHCPEHSHHLHLCLFHGASWIDAAWAIALLAAMALWSGIRIGHRVAGLWSARRGLSRIQAASRRLDAGEHDVLLSPADTSFCFVAGIIRPRIFVSTAAWNKLAEDERRAMIAHERAHAAHGDLWRRIALGLVGAMGTPLIAGRVLRAWDSATERLCDHRAAEAIGDPRPLARALVAMARPAGAGTLAAACFSPRGAEVVERVEAVLAGRGDGRRAAAWLGAVAVVTMSVMLCACAVLAGPIHHAIESLLGGF